MSQKTINIFISHSWNYSDHYEKLCEWIFRKSWSVGQASLVFKDYSVPKNDPIHNANSDRELKEAIYRQISYSNIVIIPTGMYASYSKWIGKEINGSKEKFKPILAVNPWGQERGSGVVKNNADKIVGWNEKVVVGGIWELYRNI